MATTLQKRTDLLTAELDDAETLLRDLRPSLPSLVGDTRAMALRLIRRAAEIRRELGLLPYTAAGLSPVVAVSLDVDRDWLIARVTHAERDDDDTVFLANLDDPRIASKVPVDLFEAFEELMAERSDAIDARAECEADWRLAKGWA